MAMQMIHVHRDTNKLCSAIHFSLVEEEISKKSRFIALRIILHLFENSLHHSWLPINMSVLSIFF